MRANILADVGVPSGKLEAVTFATQSIGLRMREMGGLAVAVTQDHIDDSLSMVGSQIDSRFVEQLRPWEGGVLNLFVTNRDLGASDAGLSYCYGRSRFAGGLAVVSTARLEEANVFGLALHETGHAFGLVTETSSRYDYDSDYAGHCKNDCVMENVAGPDDMDEVLQKALKSPETIGFCGGCDDHLRTVRPGNFQLVIAENGETSVQLAL